MEIVENQAALHEQLYSWDEIKKDVRSTIQLIVDKRMLYIAPQILWSGISLAIFTGLLPTMLSDSVKTKDTNEKMMKSMMAMVSLGFGEIVGSIGIG